MQHQILIEPWFEISDISRDRFGSFSLSSSVLVDESFPPKEEIVQII